MHTGFEPGLTPEPELSRGTVCPLGAGLRAVCMMPCLCDEIENVHRKELEEYTAKSIYFWVGRIQMDYFNFLLFAYLLFLFSALKCNTLHSQIYTEL